MIWAHLDYIRTAKGNPQARRISDRKSWRGGGNSNVGKEDSLYQQYIAKLSELSETAQPGAEEYRPLQKHDFERMSIKRRLMELRKIGMEADSADTAKRIFVRRDEGNYPTTHTKLETPIINIKHIAMTELLHHKHHIADKIQRLYKLVNGLRREGRMTMRRQQREVGTRHGTLLSIGVSRSRQIYETNLAIRKHCKLLEEVGKELKERSIKFNRNSTARYLDGTISTAEPSTDGEVT